MFKGFNFESERLFTAQLLKEDVDVLFEMYSDKQAMRFRGSGVMNSIDDAVLMVDNQRIVSSGISKLRLGIKSVAEDTLLGTLLLVKDNNNPNQYEIGLSLGKDHWGKGYAIDTLNMVEKELKENHSICEINAWCMNENIASIKLFKKANYIERSQNKYPQSKLFIKVL